MAFNIDANLENADWAKRTWDLPTGKKLDALLKETGMSREDLIKLPIGQWNPKNIKQKK